MSVDYYLRLLDHQERIEGFRSGIESAVGSGDRVLDLGTGLGTFAFFAVRAGAGAVWAVDGDPIVHVARAVAVANGLDDRVEFRRGEVPGVELPRDVDVLVYEDFPNRLLDDRTFRLLRHLEEEGVLGDGGRTVPRRARLCLAAGDTGAAGLPRAWPGGGGSWRERERRYGIDWTPTRSYLSNQPRSAFVGPDRLLGDPARGPALPLVPVPTAGDLSVSGAWVLDEGGSVDALVLWFDLETVPDLWVTNAPAVPTGPWGQLLLPVDPPLAVEAGEEVTARVRREILSDGAPGWLAWEISAGERTREGHEFAAYPAGLGDLHPGADRPDTAPGDPSGLDPRSPPGDRRA